MGGLEEDIELMNRAVSALEHRLVRIRKMLDESNKFLKEYCELMENTDDDEIERLKEKLRILTEIERIQRILAKFLEEHPTYEPIKIPQVEPYPRTPWRPVQPPTIWYKTDTSDNTAVWLTDLLNGEY